MKINVKKKDAKKFGAEKINKNIIKFKRKCGKNRKKEEENLKILNAFKVW